MARRGNAAILRRLREGLVVSKKSPRAASLEAGLGPDAIRDLERKLDVIPTLDTIERLAEVLSLAPEYVAFNVRGSTAAPATTRIIGEVAAGLWLDVDADERDFEQLPVGLHPGYPGDAQYGLIVTGTSINRVAQPGDVLLCVDVGSLDATDNDLVIVERRRAQGSQKEVTAKRWRRKGKIIELYPDSDDPRWVTAAVIDPRKAKDGEEIQVIAVVVGVYRPLRRK